MEREDGSASVFRQGPTMRWGTTGMVMMQKTLATVDLMATAATVQAAQAPAPLGASLRRLMSRRRCFQRRYSSAI